MNRNSYREEYHRDENSLRRRSEISAISTNIKKRQVRGGKKYWNSTANSRTPVIPVAPFQNTVLQQQRRSIGYAATIYLHQVSDDTLIPNY